MKNCLNCKYCKVVERSTDGWKHHQMQFECNANQTKQYFMKPVLNCKEYKKGGFILNE
mgnify:CR=1 FL=1